MISKIIAAMFVVFCIALCMSATTIAQSNGYKIAEPVSYKNLSIFLIHGKDQNTKGNILTLQEALERKLFVVYETSDVNELELENLSKEFDGFI